VFQAFGIETQEDYDSFINHFIASGIGTLTLGARTVKQTDTGFSLLDYDDVWLDKDSVIAPDGTIHFADIDDIEWMPYPDEAQTRKKIWKQFERNFFEFMFGLDALLSEKDRIFGMNPSIAQRRQDLASRYELALINDDFTKTEMSVEGIDLIIQPLNNVVEDVTIRLVNFNGGK
jgi:hypothetical protein